MLCLGLYRLHTKGACQSLNTRYVVTFPSRNMTLEPTDLVFVLMQFHRREPSKSYSDDSDL
jgi:hypothetical protein